MKVQEHIDKLAWIGADKALFFLYAFIVAFQINALDPKEFGLFELMRNLNIWIFSLSDSFALQAIIQFGMNPENKRKVNSLSVIIHTAIVMGVSVILFSLRYEFAHVFNQPGLVQVATIFPFLCLATLPRTIVIKLLFRDHKLNRIFWLDLVFFSGMSIVTLILLSIKSQLVFMDMFYIYVVGMSLSSILSIILAWKQLEFGFDSDFKVRRIIGFGLPLMVQGVFHSVPKQLDIYFIQYFFSTSVVGIYASAKYLFRFFEEGINASFGLIYPAAVRQIENKNDPELVNLMTKSVSFIFLTFVIIIVMVQLMQAGFTDFIYHTSFWHKYINGIPQFNILIFAALAMPFGLLSLIITALGKPKIVLYYSIISVIATVLTYYLVSMTGNPTLLPLGIVVYNYLFGILSFAYIRKHYNFPLLSIFRGISDTRNFLKSRFNW